MENYSGLFALYFHRQISVFIWGRPNTWYGWLFFSFGFHHILTSFNMTVASPQLPAAPPHVWMKFTDWVFALSSLLPHLHGCSLITAGEFGTIFVLAFFSFYQLHKCKSSFLTVGWLFSAGCCTVSCTASLTFAGFLGAFIEEIFVIWLHSLQLLKASKCKNCMCVSSFYSCCLYLSFCVQLINSVQCLEELLCQVSHLIDLLNAFVKTSSGKSIVIHYIYGGDVLGPVLSGKQSCLCISRWLISAWEEMFVGDCQQQLC